MERLNVFFILILLLPVLTECKKKEVDIVYDRKYIKEIKETRNQLAAYMTRNFIPGGNFAIALDGQLIYSEGLGLASKELNVRANRNTKFRIAEISELYTSMVYQMMVEEGILNPDSSIQYYLPDFPDKGFKITVRDLAYHTSGIRNPNEDYSAASSLQKSIDNFKNDELVNKPGFFQDPSPFNYDLLGAIMEKASGKSFARLLKEFLTDTLGMANTEVDNPSKIISNRSDFFEFNLIAQITNALPIDLSSRAPSKGILSTAEDMVKFGNAILASETLPVGLKKRLFEPIELKSQLPANIANGWIVSKSTDGRRIWGLTGGVKGGGGALLIFPDEKLVIAGAINLTANIDNIPVFEMAKLFLPESPVDSTNVNTTEKTPQLGDATQQ